MSTSDILYFSPISHNLHRRLLQDYSRCRLSIYQLLDSFKHIPLNQTTLEAIKKLSQQILPSSARQLLLQFYNPWASTLKQSLKTIDSVSHYVCRLMFCSSNQQKQIFINYELMIFRFRLFESVRGNLNYKELFQQLLKLTKDPNSSLGQIIQVSQQQFLEYKSEIYSSYNSLAKYKGKTPPVGRRFSIWRPKHLYKVSMEGCDSLISKRDCFMREGYVYLLGEQVLRILPKMYVKYLRLAMDQLGREREGILRGDTENQFKEFVMSEPTRIFGRNVGKENERKDKSSASQLKSYFKVKGKQDTNQNSLNLTNILAKSKRSFPPCMLQMYDTLISKKHLKYQARVQLTLFLKIAGLSLDQSQTFWRTNFTRQVSQSQMKQVQYSIKHLYGQQGHKIDYNAKDCNTIINSKPSSGEHHGCPFKYLGNNQLVSFIRGKYRQIDKLGTDEIMQYKKKDEFEMACRSLYEKTHVDLKERSVNGGKGKVRHPNLYFQQSQKYHKKSIK